MAGESPESWDSASSRHNASVSTRQICINYNHDSDIAGCRLVNKLNVAQSRRPRVIRQFPGPRR